MNPLLGRRPYGLRLYLLTALATAFFLVPSATASAQDIHINFEGDGSGAVVPVPGDEDFAGNPPVDCHGTEGVRDEEPGEVCDTEPTAPEGTSGIKVTHEADPGSAFAGWTVVGGTGSSFCAEMAAECSVLYFGGEITITAEFESTGPPPTPLTVNDVGGGSGETECEVSGSTEPCAASYPAGTEITLVSNADPGSEFVEFENGTGDLAACSGEATCSFTLEEASEVDARYELVQWTLTINEGGTGSGTFACDTGSGPEACEATYAHGTAVTVIATAEADSEFAEWLGDCDSVAGNECEVTMDADKTVEAIFDLLPVENAHIVFEGSGSGTVRVVPGPLEGTPRVNCTWNGETEVASGDCDVEAGEAFGFEGIRVEHEAAAGSVFGGWKIVEGGNIGGCVEEDPSAGTCSAISGGGDITIKATFEPAVPLVIEVEGEGGVTGPGIVCNEAENGEPACENGFLEGSEPELTATEETGWEFTGWTTVEGNAGSCEGTTSPCNAGPLTEATKLKATFVEVPPVPLIVEVEGEGEVTGPGITCTEADNGEPACEEELAEGSSPELTASPAAEWEFTGWTTVEGNAGSCEGTTSPCNAGPLTEATKLKATFVEVPPPDPNTLTVEPAPVGNVYSKPTPGEGAESWINCGTGSHCDDDFEGEVELIATQPKGSVFTGWEGCDSPEGRICHMTMDEDKTVKATYDTTHTLTVSKSGAGNGNVWSSPFGINCGTGAACVKDFTVGEVVTLTATQPAGSKFQEWVGPCDSNPVPRQCVVTMDEDKSIEAVYEP